MAAERDLPKDPEDLFGLLDPFLHEESVEPALRYGLRMVAEISAAKGAALFLVEAGEITAELWRPDDAGAAVEASRAPLRSLAVAAARDRAEEGRPAPPWEAGADPRLLVLSSMGRTHGIVCLSGDTLGPDPAGHREALVRRVVQVLAWKVAAHQEAMRVQLMRTQYERWFRTLDEQVRVLDRERQKFAAIVHVSDEFVFVADKSRRIRWTNSLMAAQSPPGGPDASWIGLACSAACSTFSGEREGGECDDCPVARALVQNFVVHREFRNLKGDTLQSLYLSALPIVGPHGHPDEAIVKIQDLSGLEILRQSEARYRLLFERSNKAIVMVDPATRRIMVANPMASRMTGHSRHAMLALTLDALHPPEEWARLEPEYTRAFASGALAAGECRIRSRDGSERIATYGGTRHELDGQEVVMLEFQDVTERRRVEEALREAEARLHAVVANAPIVLFATDRDGIVTMSEGRGLEALGLEPGQLVGKSIVDANRGQPEVLVALERALAGEEFTDVVPIGKLAFETRFTPLRDDEGRPAGFIGVATDVTDRRSLEERLRHSQRMEALGRLAGGVAHDFNNLLAAILGHSELLTRRLDTGDPLRVNAEEIQKAGSRGALLTGRLLAFSRKEVLSPTVLDLNLVVANMEDMLRRLIGEDVELETRLSDRPATTRADRGQLEQVLMNLVVNARDAMPQGGRLEIEVAEAPAEGRGGENGARRVRLLVRDSGCGMDAETLTHAFEPFFTTKEQGKGTGLGLSTVYGIVEQSGGSVTVDSKPGAGTTFQVFLPMVDELPTVVSDPGPLSLRSAHGTETVLVVEDEESVRNLTCELLRNVGYTVLEAVNGVDALRLASGECGRIDLLITDVVMPQMGGGELAQRLTALRPGLRVLYVSGYTDDAIVRHGVLEDGRSFLQKPFSLDVFARRVREVLDTPAEPEARARAAA